MAKEYDWQLCTDTEGMRTTKGIIMERRRGTSGMKEEEEVECERTPRELRGVGHHEFPEVFPTSTPSLP
jgi:hypothetical protein